MNLTSSHLKYLLAIYEVSREIPDVSSASVAKKLNVSKPSVSTMLTCLMNKKLLVKERYGKIYLTDSGFLIARGLIRKIGTLEEELEKLPFSLTREEIHEMAILIVTEMPEAKFDLPNPEMPEARFDLPAAAIENS